MSNAKQQRGLTSVMRVASGSAGAAANAQPHLAETVVRTAPLATLNLQHGVDSAELSKIGQQLPVQVACLAREALDLRIASDLC